MTIYEKNVKKQTTYAAPVDAVVVMLSAGPGKTTLARELAGYLASLPSRAFLLRTARLHMGGSEKSSTIREVADLLKGKKGIPKNRVLLIDGDPQGNLTNSCDVGHGPDSPVWKKVKALADVLASKRPGKTALSAVISIKFKHNAEVFLMPHQNGFEQLIGADHRLILDQFEAFNKNRDKMIRVRFRKAIEALKPYYDYIIIDTPSAAYSQFTQMAMEACDEILIPVDGHRGILNLACLFDSIVRANKERKKKPNVNIVLSKYRTTKSRTSKKGKKGKGSEKEKGEDFEEKDCQMGPEVKNFYYPYLKEFFGEHFLIAAIKDKAEMENSYAKSISSRGRMELVAVGKELMDKWENKKSNMLVDYLAGRFDFKELFESIEKDDNVRDITYGIIVHKKENPKSKKKSVGTQKKVDKEIS